MKDEFFPDGGDNGDEGVRGLHEAGAIARDTCGMCHLLRPDVADANAEDDPCRGRLATHGSDQAC